MYVEGLSGETVSVAVMLSDQRGSGLHLETLTEPQASVKLSLQGGDGLCLGHRDSGLCRDCLALI